MGIPTDTNQSRLSKIKWSAREDSTNSKNLLEKAKDPYNKDPYIAMLEARNAPIDNYNSTAELACGRQLLPILPVNTNNLTVKSADNEFKQKLWGTKSKQKKYYD